MFLPQAHKVFFAGALLFSACGSEELAGEQSEVAGTTGAIVGGWAATAEQIFATVEVRHAGASRGFCSGALISPSLVVTAAHCAVVESEPGEVRAVDSGALEVVAGHLKSEGIEQGMWRSVVEAHIHEGYDHEFVMGRSRAGAGKGGIGSPNDIALLFLGTPFDHIPNAPMLSATEAREMVHHGDVGFVAGYGVFDVEQDLAGELYISDSIIDILGPWEMLTRRPDQMGDSCYGDSGGPFYIPTEYGDFLVGLVSRGRSDVNRDCGDGGVYTLLSAYLPWIEQTAGSRLAPWLLPETEPVAFRPAGSEFYAGQPDAGLDRVRSCQVAVPSSRTPLFALWLLAAMVLAQRFAFRRAS